MVILGYCVLRTNVHGVYHRLVVCSPRRIRRYFIAITNISIGWFHIVLLIGCKIVQWKGHTLPPWKHEKWLPRLIWLCSINQLLHCIAITVLLYTYVTHHDKKNKRIICSFSCQIGKLRIFYAKCRLFYLIFFF